MSRAPAQPRPRRRGSSDWSLDDVQHIVLDGVSWELYEHLLEEMGDRPIRLTYDNGDLEIMPPLYEHEVPKTMIGRAIETLAEELDVAIQAAGSTTFRRRAKQRGLEPDECYYVQSLPLIRGKRKLSLPKDPPPDLAVEIDVTSRSIARLPIYAALGVPEVWRFDGAAIQCLHLRPDGKYVASDYSRAFPMLRPRDLMRFVEMAQAMDLTAAGKALRRWVRRQKWAK
jgi:Uma2 family endonuclease